MITRDFYFAAWLIVKGYKYKLDKGKLYIVDISKEELTLLVNEYKPLKPLMATIKKLIREINNQRNSM